MSDGAVRIEVGDRVRRAPRRRRYGADATTGRGIALVANLARAWGVDMHAGGKVVWCELDAGPDEQASTTSEDEVVLDLEAFLGPHDRDGVEGGPTGEAAARRLDAYRSAS